MSQKQIELFNMIFVSLKNVVYLEISHKVNYGEAVYIQLLNYHRKSQPYRMQCVDEEYWDIQLKIDFDNCIDDIEYEYFIADYYNQFINRRVINFKYKLQFPIELAYDSFTQIRDSTFQENNENRIISIPENLLVYIPIQYTKQINYGESIYVMWFSQNEVQKKDIQLFTQQNFRRSQRLIWNPGHIWTGTIVIPKQLFVDCKQDFLFPFIKSYYYKRELTVFLIELQNRFNKLEMGKILVREDKDITERAIYEGKQSKVRIEFTELDLGDLKTISIQGLGEQEAIFDPLTGQYFIELYADRTFFEDDNNKLQLTISNKNQIIETKILLPSQGEISTISIINKSQQSGGLSSYTTVNQIKQYNNYKYSDGGGNSGQYGYYGYRKSRGIYMGSGYSGGNPNSGAGGGYYGGRGFSGMNGQYGKSGNYGRGGLGGGGLGGGVKSYYNYREKVVNSYYNQRGGNLSQPQEIFKSSQAIIYNYYQYSNYHARNNLDNFAYQMQDSYNNFTSYCSQIQNLKNIYKSYESSNLNQVVEDIKRKNKLIIKQFEEVKRTLISKEIIEEIDQLKDVEIKLKESIPQIKVKMDDLDAIDQKLKDALEQDQNLNLNDVRKQLKIQLLIAARNWGLSLYSDYQDYDRFSNEIVDIIEKAFGQQYTKEQIISACLRINEQCRIKYCLLLEHGRTQCQKEIQTQVRQNFNQYFNNELIKVDDLYFKLEQLILNSYDEIIELGNKFDVKFRYQKFERAQQIVLINYAVLYSYAIKFGYGFKFNYCQCDEFFRMLNDEGCTFTQDNLIKLLQLSSGQQNNPNIEQLKQQAIQIKQQIKSDVEDAVRDDQDENSQRELLDLVRFKQDISLVVNDKLPLIFGLIIDSMDEQNKQLDVIMLTTDPDERDQQLQKLINQQETFQGYLF